MDDIGLITVSLPVPVLGAGFLVWLCITFLATKGQPPAFQFIYLALSVRFIANFFHQWTAPSLVAGQSLNSLITLAIILAGLVMARRYLLRFKMLLPAYLFAGFLAFSGVANVEVMGTINALLRQALFITVVLMLAKMLDEQVRDGQSPLRLMTIFIVPGLFQIYSIVFQVATFAESDGSASFVGGYIHEGVFSSLLLTALVLAVLSPTLSWRNQTLIAVAVFTALVFANYRTALLAAIPILSAHIAISSGQQFGPRTAARIRALASVVVVSGIAVFLIVMSERFSEIGQFASSVPDYLRPPTDYTTDERALFSGRLLLWGNYVYATVSGGLAHFLVGYGPDAWEAAFAKYAHNVFISYFFEVGILGTALYIAFVGYFAIMSLRVEHPRKWVLFSAHIGYLILSIGTMPTVVIEGVTLYAVVCGYTLYYHLASAYRGKTPFAAQTRYRRLARRA